MDCRRCGTPLICDQRVCTNCGTAVPRSVRAQWAAPGDDELVAAVSTASASGPLDSHLVSLDGTVRKPWPRRVRLPIGWLRRVPDGNVSGPSYAADSG